MPRALRPIAAVLTIAAFACAEDAKSGFGPENALAVINAADTFDLRVDDLKNVYAELSYTWDVTRPRARVFHCSFLPHGDTRLVVTDAAGDTVYDRPLLYRLEGATADGGPGSWTVFVGFYGSVGAWADVVLDATADTGTSGLLTDDVCKARGR